MLLTFGFVNAQSKIYNSEYGWTCVGRIENGKVYNSEYGWTCVGRIENGKVYNSEYGWTCVGRTEGSSTKSGGSALLLILR